MRHLRGEHPQLSHWRRFFLKGWSRQRQSHGLPAAYLQRQVFRVGLGFTFLPAYVTSNCVSVTVTARGNAVLDRPHISDLKRPEAKGQPHLERPLLQK